MLEPLSPGLCPLPPLWHAAPADASAGGLLSDGRRGAFGVPHAARHCGEHVRPGRLGSCGRGVSFRFSFSLVLMMHMFCLTLFCLLYSWYVYCIHMCLFFLH